MPIKKILDCRRLADRTPCADRPADQERLSHHHGRERRAGHHRRQGAVARPHPHGRRHARHERLPGHAHHLARPGDASISPSSCAPPRTRRPTRSGACARAPTTTWSSRLIRPRCWPRSRHWAKERTTENGKAPNQSAGIPGRPVRAPDLGQARPDRAGPARRHFRQGPLPARACPIRAKSCRCRH